MFERPLRPARLLAAALLLAACAEEPRTREDSRWQGTMDTLPGGTVQVSNPEGGLWRESERWRLVEDLRIGAPDGETPDVFGQVASIGIGPRGEILVLDGFAQEIRVFDTSGRHVRTIGHKGRGPGELAQAFGLSWDAAHRLWVVDGGAARYSVFDSAGTYLRSHPRRLGVVFPWLGGFSRSGELHDVAPHMEPDGKVRYVYYALDPSAAIRDSLPALEYHAPPATPLPLPVALLAPRLTFRFDPRGYLWFGMTDRYRIHQRELAGDTVRIIERPFQASRVSDAEKDSMIAEAAKGPVPLQRADIPDRKPVFERLHVDERGHVWVQLVGTGSDTPQLFDVFDPQGRYLGAVRSESRFQNFPPPLVRHDQIVGVALDESGVPYVIRARIQRAKDAAPN